VIASVKQLLELEKRVLSTKQLLQPNHRLGRWGEQQAIAFLSQKGYQILETNLSLGVSEVDLVALDSQSQELVFVEVKTRHSSRFGPASDSVGWRKLRAMQRVARAYLHSQNYLAASKGPGVDYRFDLITLEGGKICHYQNISWL
jgi:putative endonuclease